jgi:hypothetical protein
MSTLPVDPHLFLCMKVSGLGILWLFKVKGQTVANTPEFLCCAYVATA